MNSIPITVVEMKRMTAVDFDFANASRGVSHACSGPVNRVFSPPNLGVMLDTLPLTFVRDEISIAAGH